MRLEGVDHSFFFAVGRSGRGVMHSPTCPTLPKAFGKVEVRGYPKNLKYTFALWVG